MTQSRRNRLGKVTLVILSALALLPFTMVVVVQGHDNPAKDPGPRTGAAGAGGMISGLTANQQAFFTAGLANFVEADSVTGSVSGTGNGLGPRFNAESCGACHAQPAIGGTSPSVNPQFAAASDQGATNQIPSFISLSGPVREARFPYTLDFTQFDGGVHDLFTITGRSDAHGCNIAQPDFTTAEDEYDIIFRIPTPTFGAGLIESIEDTTILNNQTAECNAGYYYGICGYPNTSGNDGTITRFGWKAQNKSLLIFSGEAYNVEMGVTNNLFTQERDETPGCVFNGTPEDTVNFDTQSPNTAVGPDVQRFEMFMAFLAPPTPGACPGGVQSSCTNGQTQFNNIGCNLCHTQSLKTSTSSVAALSNQTANLYSDLLLHDMGPLLADDVTQGAADGDEFRTAPLWGLGQRLFFLHDGRETNLINAIEDHFSYEGFSNQGGYYPSSEANQVVQNYNSLSSSNQQDLLNFLRSL
ncbi:MAG TPA: di-heme oxidoredictase family protein [Terriglobia bacterium]|nr:di-heme oxidoredictase family protein [Terriglobia bacterium]